MAFLADFRQWTTLAAFESYLDTITLFPGCRAVTEHHTFRPRSRDWIGLQHVRNIAAYYVKTYNWDRGPHFFLHETGGIYQMTPPTIRGIHASAANDYAVGIEHVWDGDQQPFSSGLTNLSYGVTAALLRKMKLSVSAATVFPHRAVPGTTKSCFGLRMDTETYRRGLESFVARQTAVQSMVIDHESEFPEQEYIVTGTLGANVRQSYQSLTSTIALQLSAGTSIVVDKMLPGAIWRGSNIWLHIRRVTINGTVFDNPGFIHILLTSATKG